MLTITEFKVLLGDFLVDQPNITISLRHYQAKTQRHMTKIGDDSFLNCCDIALVSVVVAPEIVITLF